MNMWRIWRVSGAVRHLARRGVGEAVGRAEWAPAAAFGTLVSAAVWNRVSVMVRDPVRMSVGAAGNIVIEEAVSAAEAL